MPLRAATQRHSLHFAPTHDSFQRGTSHHTCNGETKKMVISVFHQQLYDLRGGKKCNTSTCVVVTVTCQYCTTKLLTHSKAFSWQTQLILIWSDYFYVQLVSIHFCLKKARWHDQRELESLFYDKTYWPRKMHFRHVPHRQAHSAGLKSHT